MAAHRTPAAAAARRATGMSPHPAPCAPRRAGSLPARRAGTGPGPPRRRSSTAPTWPRHRRAQAVPGHRELGVAAGAEHRQPGRHGQRPRRQQVQEARRELHPRSAADHVGGDPGQVRGRRPEELRGAVRPLEVAVGVVLPGDADARRAAGSSRSPPGSAPPSSTPWPRPRAAAGRACAGRGAPPRPPRRPRTASGPTRPARAGRPAGAGWPGSCRSTGRTGPWSRVADGQLERPRGRAGLLGAERDAAVPGPGERRAARPRPRRPPTRRPARPRQPHDGQARWSGPWR